MLNAIKFSGTDLDIECLGFRPHKSQGNETPRNAQNHGKSSWSEIKKQNEARKGKAKSSFDISYNTAIVRKIFNFANIIAKFSAYSPDLFS